MPKRIVLGVTGSIAAYRAADLASLLTKDGHEVDVVLTEEALRFITALTFEALTRRGVYTRENDGMRDGQPAHISLTDSRPICSRRCCWRRPRRCCSRPR